MKSTIIALGLILLFSFQSFSQLELEGVINSKFKTTQLEDGEIKYYNFDSNTSEIKIYNLDNSLSKAIKIPLERNHFFEEILMISENTINPDKGIEIAYTCLRYNYNAFEEDPESETNAVQFTLNIINESGEKLLSVPNSHQLKLATTNGKSKLLIFKSGGKSFRDDSEILVYALPDKK
jgi:hypothetical protein